MADISMLDTVAIGNTITAAHHNNQNTAITNVNNGLSEGSMTLFKTGNLNLGAALPGNLFGNLSDTALTKYFVDDGGSFTDDTTDANNSTANDFVLMPTPTTVNDAVYFGHTAKFSYIKVNVGTNGAGTYTLTWEYYNGSTWATLTFGYQELINFRDGTGNKHNVFEPPSDWTATTVNGQSAFWVRARNSTAGTMTTQPLGTQAWLGTLTSGTGITIPSARTLTVATFMGGASGSTTDTKLLFINKTAGTFTTGTWTKATTILRSDVTNLSFSANDQLVIQQVTEDSTPASNMNVVIEFT